MEIQKKYIGFLGENPHILSAVPSLSSDGETAVCRHKNGYFTLYSFIFFHDNLHNSIKKEQSKLYKKGLICINIQNITLHKGIPSTNRRLPEDGR